MFSISTVASSTRMPTASDRPPSVITFRVWPRKWSIDKEKRIESGIETATISVLRQLPRNTRIMVAVSSAATMLSCTTPEIAARTNSDWSNKVSIFTPLGAMAWIEGNRALTSRTMSSVEAPPFLRIVTRAPRPPSRRTTVLCDVEAVANLRHVADVDHGAVDRLDGNVVERRGGGRAVVEAHRILLRAMRATPVGKARL